MALCPGLRGSSSQMSPKDSQDSQITVVRVSSVHKARRHVVWPPEEDVWVVSGWLGLVGEALRVV